jgi:hypothetical protein
MELKSQVVPASDRVLTTPDWECRQAPRPRPPVGGFAFLFAKIRFAKWFRGLRFFFNGAL